jgi:alkylation response protein AidB-like acyl-CoA dehydrogenase
MSNLANAHLQSDQDVAPLLLAAQVLRTDNEALEAARSLAANAREHAGKRDLQRKLPWSLVEEFTRSGLGSLSIAREFGGPQVSFVTLAEVFAIISGRRPGPGADPAESGGHSCTIAARRPSESQKNSCSQSVSHGWRIGNAGPNAAVKTPWNVKARITADGDGFVINGQKFYSTGALFAHWVAVKALDDKAAGHGLCASRYARPAHRR